MARDPFRILFVCLGNICRSPIAEGLFRHHVEAAGLGDRFVIDSAGTSGWHTGKPPDERMCRTARERGVDITGQRARELTRDDLATQDLIVVMDRQNLANTRRLADDDEGASKVVLFRSFDPEADGDEVPDPYYGDMDGFSHVYDIVDRGCRALLAHLRRQLEI